MVTQEMLLKRQEEEKLVFQRNVKIRDYVVPKLGVYSVKTKQSNF